MMSRASTIMNPRNRVGAIVKSVNRSGSRGGN